jgi:hypothetical protein
MKYRIKRVNILGYWLNSFQRRQWWFFWVTVFEQMPHETNGDFFKKVRLFVGETVIEVHEFNMMP